MSEFEANGARGASLQASREGANSEILVVEMADYSSRQGLFNRSPMGDIVHSPSPR